MTFRTDSRFDEVVRYARTHASPWPLDLREVIERGTFDPPPWNIVRGRVSARGGAAGMIAVGGRVAAAWGDVGRADMVFSVTKSYVGLLAGIAWDEGLIDDLTRPVSASTDHAAFQNSANRDVTWLQLLQQTSEWSGALWGIPDTVDRDRQLASTDDPARFDRRTPRQPPGTYWDYNDTRVNVLCLGLTLAFGEALPTVLARRLGPFSGGGWDWQGYGAESVVVCAGGSIPVVVGGGHWGGGLACSAAHDLSLGRIVCGRGLLDGERVVSEAALDTLLAPCPLQPVYGGLWWLNTGRRLFPGAPAGSVFASGVGMNAIWVDADLDLVAVAHWIDEPAFPGFIDLVMAAIG